MKTMKTLLALAFTAGLLVFRVIWGRVGSRHARCADFPPSVTASLGQLGDMATGRRTVHVGHSPLGALMICNFLFAVAGNAADGMMMTALTWFGVEWVEEAYELLVTRAEFSVLAHVPAVVMESRWLRVDLPQAMVTGCKDSAEGAAVE